MKYSLKNKQFRKRNNIFGQRRRDQYGNQQNHDYLEEIRELASSSEESKVVVDYGKDIRNNKFSKFINFDATNDINLPSQKIQQRKNSLQHRPSKHGLSPNTQPIVNVSHTTSLRASETIFEAIKPKKLQLRSQIVNVRYVGKRKSQTNDQDIKEVVTKIYSIIMKNNDRINQIQSLLTLMMQNGKLLIRQTNKGVQKVLRVQEKINLFFNTMRSVYQNLRICKLKQENLQLYIKQEFKEKQNHISTAYEDQTVEKISKPRYRLDDLKKQMTLSVEDPSSKQLISLVDYDSNYSSSQSMTFQQPQPQFKRKSRHQFTLSLTEHQMIDNKGSEFEIKNQEKSKKQFRNEKPVSAARSNLQWQKLSPFDANKIITSSSNSHAFSRYSQHDSRLKTFHGSSADEFQTFRTNSKTFHLDAEAQKLKSWIKKLGLKGLRCWLDEMGCLRRQNMTYVFYENGQVINISRECFNELVEQGQLVPVFDAN